MTSILLEDPRCDHESLNDSGDALFVQLLKHATASMAMRDADGHVAITTELLNMMLDGVVDEDIIFSYTNGAYNEAGALGDLEAVQALAQHPSLGPNEHMRCFGLACQHGHSNIVQFLLTGKFFDPQKFIRKSYKHVLGDNPLAVATFTSVLEASTIRHLEYPIVDDGIFTILSGLVSSGATELFKNLLQKYRKRVGYQDRLSLRDNAKRSKIYSVYKSIVDCYPKIDDPNDIFKMAPLYLNMVHVKAGRIETIPKLIPIQDLDVLVYQAARNSDMAKHLLSHQLAFIKEKHYRKEVWPFIDGLLPLLSLQKPMRTNNLERVVIFLMHLLVDKGWNGEQFVLLISPLLPYLLD